jgi:hypothetical protein
MNKEKLLNRILQGNFQNIDFADLLKLAERFGFRLVRINGSHHILGHPEIQELLNLQKVGGQAKPYQVRQFLLLVEKHNLLFKGDV